MQKYKTDIISIILVLLITSVGYIFNFRVCLFYNLFKMPCPACGLTRAFILLFNFKFKKSLSYNILPIFIIIFLILFITDLVMIKKNKESFLNKHKILFIIIATLLIIISWIINLNNPLLY